ncbi:hypothetical protein NA56DRAFT_656279 [Hyaloscypha hepaticicola]|uniref:Uncharacterized protein n=1 Tax=Hyaloscypha hepaticicola TaxID=2082293 RepID=A0A2J6QE61_9HELO|nr:hypothetical protein NA56DRAFT_656279 [Hyaloscypha hepaticicola]
MKGCEVESLGVRQRGDGCGRGRGSGRPGRAMRRGLPCPSDRSRERWRGRALGVELAAPELALCWAPAGCWLALSLLALSWAVGDLRVRLEEKKHRLQLWQTGKTVRRAGSGQAPGYAAPPVDLQYWYLYLRPRVLTVNSGLPSSLGSGKGQFHPNCFFTTTEKTLPDAAPYQNMRRNRIFL